MPRPIALPQTIPGPPPHPRYGHDAPYARFIHDPIGVMMDLHHQFGELVALSQGSDKVFAFGPRLNQLILTDPDRFFCTPVTILGPGNSAQRRLGDGLFSTNGQRNRQLRRYYTPPLQRRAIESYHPRIVDNVQRTLDAWQPGQPFDLMEQMRLLTLRNTMSLLYGLEVEPSDMALFDDMERWGIWNNTVAARLAPPDRPSAMCRRVFRLAESIEAGLKQWIERRRRRDLNVPDVLSNLIRAHDQHDGTLSTGELLGQLQVFHGAAYETSANALVWALFMIAQHPPVARALMAELDTQLGGQPPQPHQLPQLRVLDNVIKETLRLVGPAVYNTRISITTVEIDGCVIPKGTIFFVSHYVTHHMEALFEQANRFNPARWRTIKPSPYEYLAFGAGPRACIGMQFADFVMKVVLSMILQRYRLTVVPHARIDRLVRITLAPKHGMPVVAHPQDGRFEKQPVRGNIVESVEM